MNNKDISTEWFEYAEQDLSSAIFLLNMKPIPYEIICYHCQQSAEKLLKGFIALNGGENIKTHDLLILNKKCIEYNNLFLEIQDDCIEITDYGVQVRYPFHAELEEADMKAALISAKKIKDFILSEAKKNSEE